MTTAPANDGHGCASIPAQRPHNQRTASCVVPPQLRVCAEAGDLRNAMHVADMLQVCGGGDPARCPQASASQLGRGRPDVVPIGFRLLKQKRKWHAKVATRKWQAPTGPHIVAPLPAGGGPQDGLDSVHHAHLRCALVGWLCVCWLAGLAGLVHRGSCGSGACMRCAAGLRALPHTCQPVPSSLFNCSHHASTNHPTRPSPWLTCCSVRGGRRRGAGFPALRPDEGGWRGGRQDGVQCSGQGVRGADRPPAPVRAVRAPLLRLLLLLLWLLLLLLLRLLLLLLLLCAVVCGGCVLCAGIRHAIHTDLAARPATQRILLGLQPGAS